MCRETGIVCTIIIRVLLFDTCVTVCMCVYICVCVCVCPSDTIATAHESNNYIHPSYPSRIYPENI